MSDVSGFDYGRCKNALPVRSMHGPPPRTVDLLQVVVWGMGSVVVPRALNGFHLLGDQGREVQHGFHPGRNHFNAFPELDENVTASSFRIGRNETENLFF